MKNFSILKLAILPALLLMLAFLPEAAFAGARPQADADGLTTFYLMCRGTPQTFGVPRTVELHQRYLRENHGVNLVYQLVDNNSYNEVVTARFAAGDFPSILYYGQQPVIQNAIDSGVFVPVTKAIMAPMLDHVDRGAFFSRWYQNGEYYGYNFHGGSLQTINLRGDWLDNLGLQMPTDTESLKTALIAMSTGDPNRDGRRTPIFGLALQGDLGFSGEFWAMWLPGLKNNPASACGLYIDFNDNTVKSAIFEVDLMKEALTWFNDIFRAGAIDPQYVTRRQLDVEGMFIAGQVGTLVKEIGALPHRFNQMQQAFPNVSIRTVPSIRNRFGDTNNDFLSYKNDAYFMTRAAPDVEKGYAIFNFLFGELGQYYRAYGEEGVEYTMQNGVFRWLSHDAELRNNTARIVSSYLGLRLLEPVPVITDNEAAAVGFNLVLDDVGRYAVATESYRNLAPDIDKIMLEGITEIIVGARPVSYLDTLIAEARRAGLDRVIADVNATYRAR